MKYLLITASICWADEFDCEVFGVFTDKQWKTLCEKTKKYFEKWENDDWEEGEEKPYSDTGDLEVCFGTNESLSFDNYKDWSRNFEEKEITKEQYDFLKKNFGQTFGTGDGAFFLANRDEDGDIIGLEE